MAVVLSLFRLSRPETGGEVMMVGREGDGEYIEGDVESVSKVLLRPITAESGPGVSLTLEARGESG